MTVIRLFPGGLHSPADHLGGMQPDDGPGRLAVRSGRICESLRPAADEHAPRPPRWQHVIDHQRDVRVALRVVKFPGPGEITAADIDGVQLRVVTPAERNDMRHPGAVDGREPAELALSQVGQFSVREYAHVWSLEGLFIVASSTRVRFSVSPSRSPGGTCSQASRPGPARRRDAWTR